MRIIKIPLYPTQHELTVFVDKKLSKVEDAIGELLDDVYLEPRSGTIQAYSLTCISNGTRYFIIGLKNSSPPEDILHEVIHSTWHLASVCGFEYKHDQEFQCYLAEYIYREILRYLKPKKK